MYYGEYKAPTRWRPTIPLGATMNRTLVRAWLPRVPARMPRPPWIEELKPPANPTGATAPQLRPVRLIRHPMGREKQQRVSGYYATPMM